MLLSDRGSAAPTSGHIGEPVQAAVSTRYGSPDILEIREVAKPEPKADEVLVRVHATTVSRTDRGMLRADPFIVRFFFGLLRPKRSVLGVDFAGEVEAIGAGVSSFKPGQRVFGMSHWVYGAHAEYLNVPENGPIATMPAGLRFEQAVVCEGAGYADMILKAFNLTAGDKILIYGASGAIWTAALQLAKCYGAKVTAVVATRHLELVKSLGADRAVDYTAEDFTQIGETFDCVLDAVGKTSYFRCRRLLKSDGVFASSDLGPWCQVPLLAIWSRVTGSNRVVFPTSPGGKRLVEFLRDRMEAGEFRAVIDRRYPLAAIADAYRYVDSMQKTGIVVINVTSDDNGGQA
ncbi:MAG: NAD(P)-dependent alcohol dehydrogenase [Hyphomicrobium sp.]|jgi:NADPH:quinone reductase-like Zn-dependent oxidoreductase